VVPLAFAFGGIAQFLAGMWAYRARDAVATAMHGMWGAFWIAYGILQVLLATKAVPTPTPAYHFPELGFWFFALAVITASGTFGALAEGNLGITAVLATLATGSGIAAGALIYGAHGWAETAGWVFVVSAAIAWYTATAMMLKAAYGHTVLPLGKTDRAANVPGETPTRPIELDWGEPGVKMGQ
jgi:succinate-acetate transporter protein